MAAGSQVRSWGSWWFPLVVGLASLVCGVLAVVWPDVTLLALALITGINLLIFSGLLIGEAIAEDDRDDKTLRIVVGVVGVIGGLVVIRHPGDTLLVLLVALGIWLVLSGLVEIVRGIGDGSGNRGVRILAGVIDAGLGVVILAWPDLSLKTLAVLVGIAFIVRGVLLMVVAWQLRRFEHAVGAALGDGGASPRPA